MSKKLIFFILAIVLLSIFGIYKSGLLFKSDAPTDKIEKWDSGLTESEINSMSYWRVDFDTLTNKEFIIRGVLLDSISKEQINLIEILNKREAKCKIEFIKFTTDTIHIKILNDEVLSEQMGTLGAYCFLAESVYTLTEIENIHFVKINMKEGSHARPGVHNRAEFKDLDIK